MRVEVVKYKDKTMPNPKWIIYAYKDNNNTGYHSGSYLTERAANEQAEFMRRNKRPYFTGRGL